MVCVGTSEKGAAIKALNNFYHKIVESERHRDIHYQESGDATIMRWREDDYMKSIYVEPEAEEFHIEANVAGVDFWNMEIDTKHVYSQDSGKKRIFEDLKSAYIALERYD